MGTERTEEVKDWEIPGDLTEEELHARMERRYRYLDEECPWDGPRPY
jgi:hypothetical protein